MKRWAAILRTGGLGDNLVAGSVLRPLKRLGYMTEVITSGLQQVAFHNNPFLDKLTVKQDGEIPGGEEGTRWFKSRAGEYDIFANLSHSMEMRHALFTHSVAFWWRPEYRRKLCAGSYLETAHDIVGVPYEFGPLYFPTDEETQTASEATDQQVKEPFVAWVVRGSRVDKLYPYSAQAISRIIKELDIAVVLVGAGEIQLDEANAIKQAVSVITSSRERCHIMIPQKDAEPWGIRQTLAATFLAEAVVTPDTGIGWAVAFEQMPKIVLHSHASVENITKHWINTTSLTPDTNKVPCWPCHRLHDDISTCVADKDIGKGAACISDISVENILLAVKNRRKSNVVRLHA